MDNNYILTAVFSILGLVVGYFVSSLLYKNKGNKIINSSNESANKILKDAENTKQEKILQAKEKFLELKAEHEEKINLREKRIIENEKKLKDKEIKLNEEFHQYNSQKKKLDQGIKDNASKSEILKTKQIELNNIHQKQVNLLEKISGYSAQTAKVELIETLKSEAKLKAQSHIQTIIEETQLNAKAEAKKIIIQAIQRIGTEQAIENSVSVFNIESDDLKGKIIGREGRNIRAIEAATGVEIIVDDTPEAILLSCFDPVRREIARLSLHKLVTDGRIHPARIEEVIAKTTQQIEEEIIETGKKTIMDLGIHGLNPELVKIVGRMKYRSSYGQNLLQHSREVANLSGILASELGLNPKLAKRAGLLHDIGKVPEQESEFPHAILGMQWAEKYGENEVVTNAIGAHHDEIEMKSLIAPIIQIADAISGARPGARRQIAESYIKRLKDLESTALSFDGVDKAFAIQAGRELRVIVKSDKIDDKRASEISFQISEKIQNELTYPGQVKVTVIRETRIVNIAR